MSQKQITTNAHKTGQNTTLLIETMIKAYALKYPQPALRSEVLILSYAKKYLL